VLAEAIIRQIQDDGAPQKPPYGSGTRDLLSEHGWADLRDFIANHFAELEAANANA